MRKKDQGLLKKLLAIAGSRLDIEGMLVRNLEEYQFLKSNGYAGKIITDAGVYVWNVETIDFWKDKVDGITCPVELNKKEWQTLFRDCNVEKQVYGRLPMMITANCISKTSGKCLRGNSSSIAYLTDRYKKKLPVIIQCNYCMNIILNSVPLSLHNKECVKWYDTVTKRLSFTTEETREVEKILKFFSNIYNGKELQPPYEEYTTGHEKRGVE